MSELARQNHSSNEEVQSLVGTELLFEDLEVGQTWRTARCEIAESDIMSFADLTGDRDPLHVDAEFAANSPFRQQIAHGLLGLSYMAGLCSDQPRVKTTAFVRIENWQFLKPIFINDSIYAVNEIVGLELHGRKHGQVVWLRKIFNHKDELVQEGRLVTLVARRMETRKIRVDSANGQVPAPKSRVAKVRNPEA